MVTVLILWLAASGWAMVRLRVLGAPALANAPFRAHKLSIATLLGVTLLYIAASFLIEAVVNFDALQKSGIGTAFVMLFDSIAKGLAILLFLPAIAFSFEGGLDGFGLSLRKLRKGVALGILAALVILPWIIVVDAADGGISQWIRHAEPPVHPVLRELAKKPEPLARAIFISTACLFAPILEEIYFRGLLQSMIAGGTPLPAAPHDDAPETSDGDFGMASPEENILSYYIAPPKPPLMSRRWLAIFLVSFLFVMIHFDASTLNFEVMPPLALLAIALGYVYERTGNLWASITLHAIFNTVSTVVFLQGHA
jgi:membrane protease YdiL (CAAX protease family)